MEQKENKRCEHRKIRYTRMVIRNSLMELMKTKSILSVSIKEICELADISRSTFYVHYKDQYDLLKQIEEEAFAYVENMLEKVKDKQRKKEIVKMIEETLGYIANNGNYIQVLLSENGDASFQMRLFQLLISHNVVLKKIPDYTQDDETMIYHSVYLIHGSIGTVQHWLKNNMSIPIPQLAKILCRWIE